MDAQILNEQSLDLIFRDAHTASFFQEKPLPESLLHQVYDLAKFGPTSANCGPARFRFLISKEAKERLRPTLDEGNVAKTMIAPVTVIVAYDLAFYDQLPHLFPQADARSWYAGKTAFIQETAFRNGTLQGAYFIIAARALGLDCGPMSGFKNKQVDEIFFQNSTLCSNFLINLGYADKSKFYPRNPRLNFDEACQIL